MLLAVVKHKGLFMWRLYRTSEKRGGSIAISPIYYTTAVTANHTAYTARAFFESLGLFNIEIETYELGLISDVDREKVEQQEIDKFKSNIVTEKERYNVLAVDRRFKKIKSIKLILG